MSRLPWKMEEQGRQTQRLGHRCRDGERDVGWRRDTYGAVCVNQGIPTYLGRTGGWQVTFFSSSRYNGIQPQSPYHDVGSSVKKTPGVATRPEAGVITASTTIV